MAKALSALLQDNVPLVRRGVLELMVQSFNPNFCHFSNSDFDILIPSAISIVLFKDVSLNRRLYQWIHLLDDHVVRVLDSMLRKEEDDVYLQQKPFRIITALLDNADYGERIFGRIFESVLDSLYSYSFKNKGNKDSVYQVATVMFQSVHPFFMWKKIQFWTLDLFKRDLDFRNQFYKRMEFMILQFKFHEEEIQKVHLPLFYFTNCYLFARYFPDQFLDSLPQVRLLVALANSIPEHVWKDSWTLSDFRRNVKESVHSPMDKQLSSPLVDGPLDSEGDPKLTLEDIKRIYTMDGSSSSRKYMETISVGSSTLVSGCKCLLPILDFWFTYFKNEAIITEEVLELWTKNQHLVKMHYTLHIDPTFFQTCDLNVLKDIALVDINYTITSMSLSSYFLFLRKAGKCPTDFLVQSFDLIWKYLSQEYRNYHEDALHLIEDLSKTFGNLRLQSQICKCLLNRSNREWKHFEKFGVIWSHFENSKLELNFALLEMFSFLVTQDYGIKNASKIWFRSHILNFSKLLQPLLKILLHREIFVVNSVSNGVWKPTFGLKFNQAQVVFALKSLIESFRLFQFKFIQYLCNTECGSPPETLERLGISVQNPSMAEFILLISTIFATGNYANIYSDGELESFIELRTVACESIEVFGNFINAFSIPFNSIQIIYKTILCSASTSSGAHVSRMYDSLKPYVPILYNPKYYQNHFGTNEAKSEIVNYMTSAILNEQLLLNIESWSHFVVAHLPFCKWEMQEMTIPLIKCICIKLNSPKPQKNWVGPNSPIHDKFDLLDFLEVLLSECLCEELLKSLMMEQFVGIVGSFYQIMEKIHEYANSSNEQKALLVRISKSLKWVTNQYPANAFEVFAFTWIHMGSENQEDATMYQIIEFTGVGPTTMMNVLLESLKLRSNGANSKFVNDAEVLQFLQFLLAKIPNSSLGNIWSSLMIYLKEINTLSTNLKFIVPYLLPFLDKVFALGSSEDRRLWKESNVTLN
jgi:hypothetical protein